MKANLPSLVDHGTFSHFVLAWNGRSWSRVANPAPGYHLPNAVSDGRGGWWTASYPSPGFGRSFLLHESGGRLTRVPLPVPRGTDMVIISLVHVPGTTTVYAAGYTSESSGRLTGVLLSI